ncbi:hypothetical protein RIF29_00203 [Crotalaria pallida]|uniref:Ubiquitin-like protease family profile domain-containing protein n=1 Tax=Crotalaria pallida TaxID=3830 RepID=A0AAN9P741_CROPI
MGNFHNASVLIVGDYNMDVPYINLTGSEASQTAGSNVNDITNESLLQAIQDLSNRLGSLEKENRELKTQLIAEQLQSTTKEFLPNLFPQKGETNNNISGSNLNSNVSEVIKKSQDPIAHISQREGSTKERAIAVDDIVGFTRFADEIGIRIGLGSRSQKSSSIVRQLFQSTPRPEVRPVKRPRTEESNKYRQFNPYINGTPSQALSPVIRAADPKGKFDCIIPKHDVLSNQTVGYILNKYNEEWMPHTRDLETIFVPVLDDTHWYLVVATLLEHKVGCLSAIMPQDMNRYTFPFYNMELKDLPVVQCQGIPNCGNKYIQFGQIDEDMARMNAMLTLLMSNINEEGSNIQKLTERMFANLKHRKSPSVVAN